MHQPDEGTTQDPARTRAPKRQALAEDEGANKQLDLGYGSATQEALAQMTPGEVPAHEQVQAAYRGGGNEGRWAQPARPAPGEAADESVDADP